MPTTLANLTHNFSNYSYKKETSLNNLPFGADQANSGNSGQPYIKNPSYKTGPVGVLEAATHTATDVLRMTKFLADAPRGPLFVAKQVGLQLTNPQLQSASKLRTDKNTGPGQSLLSSLGNTISNKANSIQNLVGSNRIYTPANFLAQIAGSAAGKHIPRQGFTLSVPKEDKYWYVVDKIEKDSGGKDNRLITLVNRFAKDKNNQEGKKLIDSYVGGPNSYLGLGKTDIYSYYSTFAASDTSNPDTVKGLNGFRPIAPSDALSINSDGSIPNTSEPSGYTSLRNTDFRAYKVQKDRVYAREVADKKTRITDYGRYNTHSRIGVINTNQQSFAEVANDRVNMVSLYYAASAAASTKDVNQNDVNGAAIRDMIKFRIKAIDNDNPGYGVYMIFRAFLDGLTDDMNAEWKPIKYVGRGESFYGYEGFTSGYSINFTVAALSKQEMKPLYQKLNFLKSTMAPDYKEGKMRGNIMEVTVGDYIKEQPGIITSLSISVPEDAVWEIALNEPDNTANAALDADMHELPQILKVSMTFIPIYNFLPRKSSEAPFIGIDDKENKGQGKEWLAGTRRFLTSKA